MSALFVAAGRTGLLVTETVGAAFVVVARTLRLALRFEIDRRETVRHTARFLFGALPVLFLTALLVGGIVAVQGLHYVDRYNATDVFGWASGLSAFREVGPLMLGLALAARVGTRNTAELAALHAYERTDALTALGLDVVRVVIAPRVVAITLTGVACFAFATTTILLTSFALASLVGDQRLSASVASLVTYLPAAHVLSGFFRMTAFSLVLAATTTAAGIDDARDPSRIGPRVFASSVASISVIVTLNLVLTFLEGA